MRIEDLDGPRVRAEATASALDTLLWLGLDSDGTPLVQSRDLEPYRRAMQALSRADAVYACQLTRREIKQAASAPHKNEHEVRFPPELRAAEPEARRFTAEDTNYRLVVADEVVLVEDELRNQSTHHPARDVGDFVVWTKRGTPSYQLAVVVDDARQGVTDVVRGDDLLPSAARQLLLYRALGLPPPRWWHVPLVLGEDGHRLAKRHGDTRVASYREAGVRPERVVGLLAAWCGVTATPEPLSAADFRDRFRIDRLSSEPVTFTQRDHAWLLG